MFSTKALQFNSKPVFRVDDKNMKLNSHSDIWAYSIAVCRHLNSESCFFHQNNIQNTWAYKRLFAEYFLEAAFLTCWTQHESTSNLMPRCVSTSSGYRIYSSLDNIWNWAYDLVKLTQYVSSVEQLPNYSPLMSMSSWVSCVLLGQL